MDSKGVRGRARAATQASHYDVYVRGVQRNTSSSEGHYAWDLGPNSMMTNANVDTIAQGASGRNLKLSYQGGSNEVTVPPNVPVVTYTPAARIDPTAGKTRCPSCSPTPSSSLTLSAVRSGLGRAMRGK
jgi:hypothetical protein